MLNNTNLYFTNNNSKSPLNNGDNVSFLFRGNNATAHILRCSGTTLWIDIVLSDKTLHKVPIDGLTHEEMANLTPYWLAWKLYTIYNKTV